MRGAHGDQWLNEGIDVPLGRLDAYCDCFEIAYLGVSRKGGHCLEL